MAQRRGVRKHTAKTKRKIALALMSKKRKNKIRNRRVRKKVANTAITVGNELVRAGVVGGALGLTKFTVESALEGNTNEVFTKKSLKSIGTGAALGTATYGVANTVGSLYDSQTDKVRMKLDKSYRKKRRRAL